MELECPIPLIWLFVTLPSSYSEVLRITKIIFSVIDELGLDDTRFSAEFDWINVTDQASTCNNVTLEEF